MLCRSDDFKMEGDDLSLQNYPAFQTGVCTHVPALIHTYTHFIHIWSVLGFFITKQ